MYRIRRKKWMRLIPSSKHFECDYCRNKFLVLPPGLYKNAGGDAHTG
jgi:hypothetical protein